MRIVDQKVHEFAKNERFMIRIQAIHFIVRLAPELQKDVFNKQFMDVIL